MITMTGNTVSSSATADSTAVAIVPPPTGTAVLKNKVAIGFLNQDTDVQLVTGSSRIVAAMTGNAFYPSPLPALATIGTARDAFAAAVNALDRSKGSAVRRDQARLALVQLLRDLALYVQQASGGDPNKLLGSGFPLQRKRGPTVVGLLPPQNVKLRQAAVSGRLLARCKADATAKSYQWRIAIAQAPSAWTTFDTVTTARFTFDNLLPGTQYLVQVRSFARSGSSNWSNSVAMFAI